MLAAKKKMAKNKVRNLKTVPRKVKPTPKAKVVKTLAKKTKISTQAKPASKMSKPYTKSALLATLADRAGLTKKDVDHVLSELTVVVGAQLKKGGPGKFILPGMLKMTVKNVPARGARKGINPFTKEPTIFKAKPASRKVKITGLKMLKEMAL